jgi:PAB-dependent poly(A)-specific ribonuclease subunit 2
LLNWCDKLEVGVTSNKVCNKPPPAINPSSIQLAAFSIMASPTSFRPLPSITHQRDVVGQPVTALAFDPVSDALWTGSNTGMIYSYYGAAGLRGVSFPVGGNLAVKKILVGEDFVRAYSVDSNGLGSWSKGGVNKWYFR